MYTNKNYDSPMFNFAETERLAYGTYVYDIQLTTEDGTVDTVVPPHPFVLKEEVTF